MVYEPSTFHVNFILNQNLKNMFDISLKYSNKKIVKIGLNLLDWYWFEGNKSYALKWSALDIEAN